MCVCDTILIFQGSDAANPRCSEANLLIPFVSQVDSLVTDGRRYCLWRLSFREFSPLSKRLQVSTICHVSPLLRAGEDMMLQSRKHSFLALR